MTLSEKQQRLCTPWKRSGCKGPPTQSRSRQLPNNTANDESPSELEVNALQSISVFSKKLDIACLEFGKLFSYSDCEINTFWQKYYGVVHLSYYNLNQTELRVLGRGLKFCPTPPVYDHGRLKESLDRFFRTMTLFLFFESNNDNNVDETNDTDPKPFSHKDLKLPSTFNPVMPSNLECMYHSVMEKILKHNPTKERRRDLSNEEYKCLTKLAENKDIVIKKADKGSNTVILDRSQYVKEGEKQLNDSKYYEPQSKDLTLRFKK